MDIVSGELLSPIFDEFKWSFSRINSYKNCPRAWYIQYVLKHYGGENFFSQYGSFVHKIMEMYGKGELKLEELLPYYEENYEKEVWMDSPPNKWKNLKEDYYYKAHKYFEDFKGFDTETVGVEYPVDFTLTLPSGKSINMCGYIDRIARLKDGTIQIVDYKSRKNFKNQKELESYLYQLYLYSIPIMEKEKVTKLTFDMFKECIKVDTKYDPKMMKKTLNWVDSVLKEIYSDSEFPRSKDVYNDFFCKNLCGVYEECLQDATDEELEKMLNE